MHSKMKTLRFSTRIWLWWYGSSECYPAHNYSGMLGVKFYTSEMSESSVISHTLVSLRFLLSTWVNQRQDSYLASIYQPVEKGVKSPANSFISFQWEQRNQTNIARWGTHCNKSVRMPTDFKQSFCFTAFTTPKYFLFFMCLENIFLVFLLFWKMSLVNDPFKASETNSALCFEGSRIWITLKLHILFHDKNKLSILSPLRVRENRSFISPCQVHL